MHHQFNRTRGRGRSGCTQTHSSPATFLHQGWCTPMHADCPASASPTQNKREAKQSKAKQQPNTGKHTAKMSSTRLTTWWSGRGVSTQTTPGSNSSVFLMFDTHSSPLPLLEFMVGRYSWRRTSASNRSLALWCSRKQCPYNALPASCVSVNECNRLLSSAAVSHTSLSPVGNANEATFMGNGGSCAGTNGP